MKSIVKSKFVSLLINLINQSTGLRVDSLSFSVEKLRELNVGLVNNKQHLKKLEREEEKLKNHNREMSLVKMKSMMAIGLAFTALLSLFNSMCVAQLDKLREN